MELSTQGVHDSIKKGLAVIQGDADTDLQDYSPNAFDYVVLSQTLQATHNPREVVQRIVRIGRYGIVSFPNFGYWRIRLSLLWFGRMPITKTLPSQWYETPNIHLCSVRDFQAMCRQHNIVIEKASCASCQLADIIMGEFICSRGDFHHFCPLKHYQLLRKALAGLPNKSYRQPFNKRPL